MYQKHLYAEKARYSTGDPIPFLASSSKFADGKGPTRSVYAGKQLVVTCPKKLAAGQEGSFSKMTYAPHEYDDSTGTLKAYPLDTRKLGFYTRMPPARDQFTQTLQMERYREHIKHEFRHVDRKILGATAPSSTTAAGATAAGAAGGDASGATARVLAATSSRVHAAIEREGRDVKEDMPATLYDLVHGDHTRPDWQKTSRDVWYHSKLRPIEERRRLGTDVLTSEAYGYGVDEVIDKPAHGKRGAWKDFYDHGHIDGRTWRSE